MTPEELDQIETRMSCTSPWVSKYDVYALVAEVRAQRAEIARLQNIIALLEV